MRFLQSTLLTLAILFATGTALVGESPETVEQVPEPNTGEQMPTPGPSSCCMGPIRGNVDYDQYDVVDVTDVVYLIDWMFRGGPEPPCMIEINVDGSCCADPPSESGSDITISDLVYLVEYLFADGPPPVPSPTTERWEKTYGGAESDEAIAVAQADDGGYIVVGSTASFGLGGGDLIFPRESGHPVKLGQPVVQNWPGFHNPGSNDGVDDCKTLQGIQISSLWPSVLF